MKIRIRDGFPGCEQTPYSAQACTEEHSDREDRGIFGKQGGAEGLTRSPRWQTHRLMLSSLSALMAGMSFANPAVRRELINEGGVRSLSSQSAFKNTGENFVNLIVYALADALAGQDEVLVEKKTPNTCLKDMLKVEREFDCQIERYRKLSFRIEVDICIFSRSKPTNAIIVSAKTRLKEVFHLITMWKLFFDMVGDDHCGQKWNLKWPSSSRLDGTMYVAATADMIPKTGKRTQGPDVERKHLRPLIAADASFVDYAFVSKPRGTEPDQLEHVADALALRGQREAPFHELGCLLDLIAQKFDLD